MSSSSTDPRLEETPPGDPRPPPLSVVIVSFSSERLLTHCLEVLGAQALPNKVEILVVRDWRRAERGLIDPLKLQFTTVRWIDAPQDCTVPRMRSLGIRDSRGDIVALLEDDCVVGAGWCDAVIAAHRTPDFAIGGAVEPGPYRRALDWGVYFCDYGRFMLPLRSGATLALPGNNTSYKRAALARLPANFAHEFYEVFVHWAWQRERAPMRADQSVRVTNVHSWTLADVTRVPYHHGRAFAGQRFADQPLWRRVVLSVLAPGLPALKIARIVKETVSRKRLIGRLFQALPWIVLLTTSWSIGESVGYLCGPGDSASAWH